MSVIMTAAGEALKARLQAEGKPLVIDTFVFAHIPNLDPTEQLTPGITVPTEQVVYTYPIPDEYRAYVNPNQVVYSALLGSDVGDWSFNWQGLVCSEYDTLIAAATFPTLEKRKYSGATGAAGNNLTRNFLLEFSGAKELTGITISADVWQLDFTIRLLGMDERERLSNFDLYGAGWFSGDGWKLARQGGQYALSLIHISPAARVTPRCHAIRSSILSEQVMGSACLSGNAAHSPKRPNQTRDAPASVRA